jgi:adenylate kinase family enzyme
MENWQSKQRDCRIRELRNILIFGNSGSGKSTLAKKLCSSEDVFHLDLDTLAWKPTTPPERMPLEESAVEMLGFFSSNRKLVIEGCYSDLLEIAVPFSDEVIFMNLPVESCIENAKNRPWEPHKYESKEAQDNNLEMLIDWISQYFVRNDTFSELAHTRLYEQFPGKKSMVTSNQ